MKIKLSKSQWEFMGRKAGWMKMEKKSQNSDSNTSEIINKAVEMWKSKDTDGSIKLLNQIDPTITIDDINSLLNQKTSNTKVNIAKESSVKSWLAKSFVAALLAGGAVVGINNYNQNSKNIQTDPSKSIWESYSDQINKNTSIEQINKIKSEMNKQLSLALKDIEERHGKDEYLSKSKDKISEYINKSNNSEDLKNALNMVNKFMNNASV